MKLSNIPVIGPIIEKHETARLSKDIQALSESDIKILEKIYLNQDENTDEGIEDHWGPRNSRSMKHLERVLNAPESRLINAHKQVLAEGNAASFVNFLDVLVLKSDVLGSYTPAEIDRAASDKSASLPTLISAVNSSDELSVAITQLHVARHLTHGSHQENFNLLYMVQHDDKLMRVFDESEIAAITMGLFKTNIHALGSMAEILEVHPSLNAVYQQTINDMITIKAGELVRSGYYDGFKNLSEVNGAAEILHDFISQRSQTLFNAGAYSEIANMASGLKNLPELRTALSTDLLKDTARHLWASERHNAYAVLASSISPDQAASEILNADDVKNVAANLLEKSQTLHYAQLMESVANDPAMAGIFPKTHIVRYTHIYSHEGKGRHITLLFNEKGQFAAQADRGASRAQATGQSLASIKDAWIQRSSGLDMDAGYIEEAVAALAHGRKARDWANTAVVPDYVRPIAQAQLAEAAKPRTLEAV